MPQDSPRLVDYDAERATWTVSDAAGRPMYVTDDLSALTDYLDRDENLRKTQVAPNLWRNWW